MVFIESSCLKKFRESSYGSKMSGVTIFFALLSVLVAVTYVSAAPSELYSDKYDFVNIDEILSNDRIRKQYSKCYLNTGPCVTPDAKFFKGAVFKYFLKIYFIFVNIFYNIVYIIYIIYIYIYNKKIYIIIKNRKKDFSRITKEN